MGTAICIGWVNFARVLEGTYGYIEEVPEIRVEDDKEGETTLTIRILSLTIDPGTLDQACGVSIHHYSLSVKDNSPSRTT